MSTNRLNEINKELKIYINEASFISNSCKNKLLKIFNDEFNTDLDISNYKNVDLTIKDDFKILYREDLYESKDNIKSLQEVEERYNRFKEKADNLIKRKEIDFKNMSNMKNISNLIIIICLILLSLAITILCIHSFLVGDYFDCIWFIIFILPWIFPKLKENISNRWIQAKRYLKSLFKKVK